ncbi:hypothetical protein [Streptomyces sp. NPDC015350]|uniref:hypothetical protein n=1 Tax=Streptomyces sp. NPDC015350 TaxID=3364955 RepID=UPI0036FFF807
MLFDVEHNVFWHPAWPSRPAETSEALHVARTEPESVPQLVPVRGHRYMPGTAGEYGHPVLSAHQTDIILYGNDLADCVQHEFAGRSNGLLAHATVGFWSYCVGEGRVSMSPRPRRSRRTPRARRRPSTASGCSAVDGRGLLIVAATAGSRGVEERTGPGKCVWAAFNRTAEPQGDTIMTAHPIGTERVI